MPARNILQEDDNVQEIMEGDEIVNSTSQKIVRITDLNGNVQQIIMGEHTTAPDENGSYIDTELINVQTDWAGNPLPEDPRSIILSHTGLYIPSREQLTSCTSRFHPAHRSRNIFIGIDGRLKEEGAICTHCDSWINSIYIVIGIIGAGLIIGLFGGVGLF